MTSLGLQQQQHRYKPKESTLCHIRVWGRVLTTEIFDKHLSLVDTYHAFGTLHSYKYWRLVRYTPTVGKSDKRQRNNPRLFIYQGQTSCFVPLLVYTSHADKWLVWEQYYLVRQVVRVVSLEHDHNVHSNIRQMYPSTIFPRRANSITVMHVPPCTSIVQSTVIGAFVKYASHGKAPLLMYVDRMQGNDSNVVCHTERCLIRATPVFCFSMHVCVCVCVLDTPQQ
jgi:hypothetical protein